MQQVLFTVAGIPMYGFGAMLFICFVAVTLWGSRRAKRTADMPPERFQDMVIWLFVSGIVGARVLYMIQYAHNFPDQSIGGLLAAFFKIWEGGIIFYGSALGGVIGYGLFYWFVLRKLHVNGWQLADAVAPLLALGLAVGRIGCYLNGCCWGQVACEECRTVPLGAAHFPLLPAHARAQLVREQGLQTTTGFVSVRGGEDPRTQVRAVEVGSPAEKAGLKPGDVIIRVNGEPNSLFIDLSGSEEKVKAALAAVKGQKDVQALPNGRTRLEFDDPAAFTLARTTIGFVDASVSDRLEDAVREWPRGASKLTLGVQRTTDEGAKGGKSETLDLPPFTPATIGLYPTQLYETVSMVLLIFLLLAYYPYRRHDGQLMVLLMVGYAVHRFINESLRIEPTVGGTPLTLSQWGSVVIFLAAVAIEVYLWRAMPSRWAGGGAPPAPTPTPATPSTAPTAAPMPATANPSGDATAPPQAP